MFRWLFFWLPTRRLWHAASVEFAVPRRYHRGKRLMDRINLPVDQIATVGLVFRNTAGGQVKGPSSGGVVVSANPGIATAELAADGNSVDITPVSGAGSATITYSNGSMSASLVVDLVAGTSTGPTTGDDTAPVSVEFNVGSLAFRPLSAPASTQPTPPDATQQPTAPAQPANPPAATTVSGGGAQMV